MRESQIHITTFTAPYYCFLCSYQSTTGCTSLIGPSLVSVAPIRRPYLALVAVLSGGSPSKGLIRKDTSPWSMLKGLNVINMPIMSRNSFTFTWHSACTDISKLHKSVSFVSSHFANHWLLRQTTRLCNVQWSSTQGCQDPHTEVQCVKRRPPKTEVSGPNRHRSERQSKN